MPERRTPTRPRLRRAFEWIGLAIALGLGLRPSVQVAAGKAPLPHNDISEMEAAFVGLARIVPPDARIGWILPREAPAGLAKTILISQYALLPRRLKVVTVARCAQAGRAACGLDDVDVAVIPRYPDYSGVEGATELGFEISGAPDRAIVFGVRRE